MKKLITIMLVAMIPFITMAQRGKKNNDSSNKYEFMIIKGVEIHDQMTGADGREAIQDGRSAEDGISHEQITSLLKGKSSKLIISFDVGNNKNDVTKINKKKC